MDHFSKCFIYFSVDHLSKYLAIRLSLESQKVDAGIYIFINIIARLIACTGKQDNIIFRWIAVAFSDLIIMNMLIAGTRSP